MCVSIGFHLRCGWVYVNCVIGNVKPELLIGEAKLYMPYSGPKHPLFVNGSYRCNKPKDDFIKRILKVLFPSGQIDQMIPCYGPIIKALMFGDAAPSFSLWVIVGEYLVNYPFKVFAMGGNSLDVHFDFTFLGFCQFICQHHLCEVFLSLYNPSNKKFLRDLLDIKSQYPYYALMSKFNGYEPIELVGTHCSASVLRCISERLLDNQNITHYESYEVHYLNGFITIHGCSTTRVETDDYDYGGQVSINVGGDDDDDFGVD
jgi:hypothetical protein